MSDLKTCVKCFHTARTQHTKYTDVFAAAKIVFPDLQLCKKHIGAWLVSELESWSQKGSPTVDLCTFAEVIQQSAAVDVGEDDYPISVTAMPDNVEEGTAWYDLVHGVFISESPSEMSSNLVPIIDEFLRTNYIAYPITDMTRLSVYNAIKRKYL